MGKGRKRVKLNSREQAKCPIPNCSVVGRYGDYWSLVQQKQIWTDIWRDGVEYIDSQPFYEHVIMKKKGIRKSNMSLIVHELGWSELMNFYDRNSYGALSDAETLCLLSTSKSLIKRYLGWKHFQLLLRSNSFPVVSMRTQSVK